MMTKLMCWTPECPFFESNEMEQLKRADLLLLALLERMDESSTGRTVFVCTQYFLENDWKVH